MKHKMINFSTNKMMQFISVNVLWVFEVSSVYVFCICIPNQHKVYYCHLVLYSSDTRLHQVMEHHKDFIKTKVLFDFFKYVSTLNCIQNSSKYCCATTVNTLHRNLLSYRRLECARSSVSTSLYKFRYGFPFSTFFSLHCLKLI